MKKWLKHGVALLIVVALLGSTIGCGDTKTINGTMYDTYGLINADDKKNPDIQYEPVWGNIVWGVILSETIVAPIYFFGFSMFEPVGVKPTIRGAVPE